MKRRIFVLTYKLPKIKKMEKIPIYNRNVFIFGMPVFLIGLMVTLSILPVFRTNTAGLSNGITFDLLVTVPLLYVLLIHKSKISYATVLPLLLLNVVICSLIVPTENQYYLNIFKSGILPLLELVFLAFLTIKVKNAIKKSKLQLTKSSDFYTNLIKICDELLPPSIAAIALNELGVLYYGFIFWKKRQLASNEFTYHKDSGMIALLLALIMVIIIETFAIHILIAKWNFTIAWVLTFLSIYSAIQIFGFLKSMIKRPITIEDNKLHLRYGIMSATTITLENIESIAISSDSITTNNKIIKLSVFGELEAPNIIIHLKKENILFGLYGIKKKYKILHFYVDNKTNFLMQVNNAINLLK